MPSINSVALTLHNLPKLFLDKYFPHEVLSRYIVPELQVFPRFIRSFPCKNVAMRSAALSRRVAPSNGIDWDLESFFPFPSHLNAVPVKAIADRGAPGFSFSCQKFASPERVPLISFPRRMEWNAFFRKCHVSVSVRDSKIVLDDVILASVLSLRYRRNWTSGVTGCVLVCSNDR